MQRHGSTFVNDPIGDTLTPEEQEGLALTQAQILDSYNSGSAENVRYFSRADILEAPFDHTDEDA